MKKMTALYICTMLLAVLMLVTGCGSSDLLVPLGLMEPLPNVIDQLGKTVSSQPTNPTSTVKSGNYYLIFDNSVNMKGFSAMNCNTLPVVEAACLEASQGEARMCYTTDALVFNEDSDGDISEETQNLLEKEASAAENVDSFFAKLSGEEFFKNRTLDGGKLSNILTFASRKSDHDSVCIFVSDLMLPGENDCVNVAEAIRSKVLSQDGTSIGIIGILGDFYGNIKNYPNTEKINLQLTSTVKDKDNYGNFRHPVYMVFIGNENLVFSAMERALAVLERSNALDDTNPVEAALFSGYKTEISSQSRVSLDLKNNLSDHNYDAGYIFRGVRVQNAKISYPSKEPLTQDQIDLIENIPFARVYDGARGDSNKNVHVQMTLPYDIVNTPNSAELGSKDRFGLLENMSHADWTDDDFKLNIDLSMLDYRYSQTGNPENDIAKWVEADSSLLYQVGKPTFSDDGTICFDIDFTLNVDALKRDVPAIFSITLSAVADPTLSHYDADDLLGWINNWTLNVKQYSEELAMYRSKAQGTSAAFTEITTARTPYLSSLIGMALYDAYADANCARLTSESMAYTKTVVFGVVVRGIPEEYRTQNWDPTNNLGGWAFSRAEADELVN